MGEEQKFSFAHVKFEMPIRLPSGDSVGSSAFAAQGRGWGRGVHRQAVRTQTVFEATGQDEKRRGLKSEH